MKKSIILTLLTFCTSFSTAIFAVEPTGDATFQDLLKEFPQGKLPYTLTADALKHQLLQQYELETRRTKSKVVNRISRKYYTLLPDMVRFSRIAKMPEPVMALESKTNYALIYTVTHYGVEYKVAVYDKQGAFLYNQVLAFASQETLQAVVLDENLKATFSMYDLIWEKDIKKEGYKKNNIKTLTLAKKSVVDLTIVPKSEKKEQKEPANIPKSEPVQSKKQPTVIRV
jgi:hypothetical protein